MTSPEIYVVMFRADWCAPCKVVEPALHDALNQLRDPGIEHLTIDITTPARSEISAHKAFDRRIVRQYNDWMGITGFAAIIDGDTKTTMGCVNISYDRPSMVTHIRNLKNLAVSNQQTIDTTCPGPNPKIRH